MLFLLLSLDNYLGDSIINTFFFYLLVFTYLLESKLRKLFLLNLFENFLSELKVKLKLFEVSNILFKTYEKFLFLIIL